MKKVITIIKYLRRAHLSSPLCLFNIYPTIFFINLCVRGAIDFSFNE